MRRSSNPRARVGEYQVDVDQRNGVPRSATWSVVGRPARASDQAGGGAAVCATLRALYGLDCSPGMLSSGRGSSGRVDWSGALPRANPKKRPKRTRCKGVLRVRGRGNPVWPFDQADAHKKHAAALKQYAGLLKKIAKGEAAAEKQAFRVAGRINDLYRWVDATDRAAGEAALARFGAASEAGREARSAEWDRQSREATAAKRDEWARTGSYERERMLDAAGLLRRNPSAKREAWDAAALVERAAREATKQAAWSDSKASHHRIAAELHRKAAAMVLPFDKMAAWTHEDTAKHHDAAALRKDPQMMLFGNPRRAAPRKYATLDFIRAEEARKAKRLGPRPKKAKKGAKKAAKKAKPKRATRPEEARRAAAAARALVDNAGALVAARIPRAEYGARAAAIWEKVEAAGLERDVDAMVGPTLRRRNPALHTLSDSDLRAYLERVLPRARARCAAIGRAARKRATTTSRSAAAKLRVRAKKKREGITLGARARRARVTEAARATRLELRAATKAAIGATRETDRAAARAQVTRCRARLERMKATAKGALAERELRALTVAGARSPRRVSAADHRTYGEARAEVEATTPHLLPEFETVKSKLKSWPGVATGRVRMFEAWREYVERNQDALEARAARRLERARPRVEQLEQELHHWRGVSARARAAAAAAAVPF
jgi:hypothetical protein